MQIHQCHLLPIVFDTSAMVAVAFHIGKVTGRDELLEDLHQILYGRKGKVPTLYAASTYVTETLCTASYLADLHIHTFSVRSSTCNMIQLLTEYVHGSSHARK